MIKDYPDEALKPFNTALGLHPRAAGEPVALMARRRNAMLRSSEKRGVAPEEKREP
jgi:hypothetical protein